jgi:hypothetical protein
LLKFGIWYLLKVKANPKGKNLSKLVTLFSKFGLILCT